MRSIPFALAALAVSALLAGQAQAQSSVTVYGKLDIGLRKATGSETRDVATSGDSRIGFRGVEDLGDGLKAFFQIEHRFFPDTGAVDGSQFWKGVSNVGLQGSWGRIGFGRQYTAAFSLVQNPFEPFAGDTVAQTRDAALRVGGITKVRTDGSIRYDYLGSAANFAVSLGEADKNGGPQRPWSVAGNVKFGPVLLAAGIENPAGDTDRQWNLGASWTLPMATLMAGYARGTTNADVQARGWSLGANVPVGAGVFKAVVGSQQRDGQDFVRKLGLGYHHSLSKRTMLYVDVAHDSEAATSKTGYDAGILHTF